METKLVEFLRMLVSNTAYDYESFDLYIQEGNCLEVFFKWVVMNTNSLKSYGVDNGIITEEDYKSIFFDFHMDIDTIGEDIIVIYSEGYENMGRILNDICLKVQFIDITISWLHNRTFIKGMSVNEFYKALIYNIAQTFKLLKDVGHFRNTDSVSYIDEDFLEYLFNDFTPYVEQYEDMVKINVGENGKNSKIPN